MQLLISDANILIDLEDGLLLDNFFNLPYLFKVPDILFEEELQANHAHLIGLGLQVGELTEDAMIDAYNLTQKYCSPSRNDCFALALARQEQCPLLTGDKRLRNAAEQEDVPVKGTLWVVEQMVIHKIINKDQGSQAYDRMKDSGSRLPWHIAHERLRKL